MNCLIVLLFLGADPCMSGPESIDPGAYARLSVENLPVEALSHAETTVWPLDSTELLPLKTWSNEALMLFRAELPGLYLVKVTVPVLEGKEARLLSVEHIIEVRGPPNPPKPPIPPKPEPGKVARVVVVEESGDRTPEQAAILTDPRLLSLKQSGKLLVLDQDATDSQGQPAAELAQYDGEPLPRVIGLDASGVRSIAAELPGTADGLIDLLKGWGVL